MNQQPFTQKDLSKMEEYAKITLRALAPMIQDVDITDQVKVDCLCSHIANACYAMGVCMLEQYESAMEQMVQVNVELAKKNK